MKPKSRVRHARRRRFDARLECLEGRELLTTFTVTNTLDSGKGSLRQAILDADANARAPHSGPDQIVFSLGPKAHKITPLSPLPDVTDRVEIDAVYPDFSTTTPRVEIDGSRATSPRDQLLGIRHDGLRFFAGGKVFGLVINGFSGNGISLLGTGGVNVISDYIGTDAKGRTARPNGGDGVYIASPNNFIGDLPFFYSPNVISGNLNDGVELVGMAAHTNMVQSNNIGVDVSGRVAVPNGTGVAVQYGASHNTVGGSWDVEGNVISGNSGDGIDVIGTIAGANANEILGNWVGTNRFGDALGNANGVLVNGATNTKIGSDGSLSRNTIGHNRGSGVVVMGSGTRVVANDIVFNASYGVYLTGGASNNSVGEDVNPLFDQGNMIASNGADGVFVESGSSNSIFSNRIHDNAGKGIRIAPGANTAVDWTVGPVPPLITAADGVFGHVTGQLHSRPNRVYTIQFFSNPPPGSAQGAVYLGELMVTTDSWGDADFTFTPTNGDFSLGDTITATATDSSGNTSEFSAGVLATLPLF